MTRILLYIGRFIAILVAPLMVLMLAMALAMVAFMPAITDPQNIKDGLVEQNIYRDVVPMVLPIVLETSTNSDDQYLSDFVTKLQESLTEEDWRAVTNEIIPPSWIQEQVEGAIDALYAYIQGAPAIEYRIDINTLSQRIQGAAGERAIRRILTLARPCTGDEISQIRNLTDLNTFDSTEIPVCSPAQADDSALMERYLKTVFTFMGEALEGNETLQRNLSLGFLEIEERINPDGEANLNINDTQGERDILIGMRAIYQVRENYVPAIFTAPIAIFGLIIFFAIRSFKGLLRWLGWISIASSIVLVIFLLSVSIGIIQIPQPTDAPPDTNIPPEIMELQVRITNGILVAAFADFTQPVIGQIFLLSIFGILLLTGSILFKGPEAIIRLQNTSS